MAEKAYITPEVFKWARLTARISLEQAANKVKVQPEKITAWEQGDSYPTVRQATILSGFYRRPLAVMFLPDIPRDFDTLRDFRRSDSRELSTASIFMIREIQEKQAWVSDLNREDQESPLEFVGKFTIDHDPEIVAKDILKTLDINPLRYPKNRNPILQWVDRAEAIGIYVSRASNVHSAMLLDASEMQGFAICDGYAPFVFVNSRDWDAPQLFTLVHELAHIWINESGISNYVGDADIRLSRVNDIERFCNSVAAHALIPLEFFSNRILIWDDPESVFRCSRDLGISSYALLVRGLKLNLITLTEYRDAKALAEERYQSYIKKLERQKEQNKKKDGFPSPYLLAINKNSKLFTVTVLSAYNSGQIQPSEASNLLNIKLNNFNKLRQHLNS